jgi:hypothetical protein
MQLPILEDPEAHRMGSDGRPPVEPDDPDDGQSYSDQLWRALGFVGREIADPVERPGLYGRIAGAAFDQISSADLTNSRRILQEQSIDGIIAAVEKASGTRLQNPLRGGYYLEGIALADEEFGPGEGHLREFKHGFLQPYQMRAFERAVDQLAAADPKVANAVAGAKIDFAPAMIARRAEQELEALRMDAGSYTGSFLAQLVGGTPASLRDPITVATLPLGAGAAVGRTAIARGINMVAREAALNGWVTLLQQPFVQDHRAELGLEAGLEPAAKNVLFGALFGGGIGGLIQVGREVGPAARALVDLAFGRHANPADVAAAVQTVGRRLPEQGRAGAIANEIAADAAKGARQTEGVEASRHHETPADTLHHANALDRAQQRAQDLPTGEGATDAAAVRVLKRSDLDPISALRLIREDPALVESALSSLSLRVREAGEVARLGDRAFGFVANGTVEPRFGAFVAHFEADPERQAALMSVLAEGRPANWGEALKLVDDAVGGGRVQAGPGVAARKPARLGSRYVEDGPFGPVFAGYESDFPAGAALLQRLGRGELRGALYHPAVGPIDVPWGTYDPVKENGLALAKIVQKHREALAWLPHDLARMKVESRSANRVRLIDGNRHAVVSLNFHGERKTWILSAYERKDSRPDESTMERPAALPDGAHSPHPPATDTIAPGKRQDNS